MNRLYHSNGYWIIGLSFLLAILFQSMPWPEKLHIYRPAWLMLILIYWVMALPHRVNIGTGFVLGLILDLITSAYLGTHALALSIVTYLVAFRYQALRVIALWQQMIIIVLLSLIMDTTIFCTEYLINHNMPYTQFYWHSFTNGILRPWLFLLMRKIRHQFIVQ